MVPQEEDQLLDDMGIDVPRRGDLPKIEEELRRASRRVREWFRKYDLDAITLPKRYRIEEMDGQYQTIYTRRGPVTILAGLFEGYFDPENLSITLNAGLIHGTPEYNRLVAEYRRNIEIAESIYKDPEENPELRERFGIMAEYWRGFLNNLEKGEESQYALVHEILHLCLVAAMGIKPIEEYDGVLAVDNRPILEGFNELVTYTVLGYTPKDEGNLYTVYARRVETILREMGYEDVGLAISTYLKRGINGLHLLGNEIKEAYRRKYGTQYLSPFIF
ncbi:MAG: hypothetical protein QXY45_03390 [Candidatus Aenigmatarchaeota archaeon]